MTHTPPRWDALRVSLALTLLAYVWRLQDLFPVLAAVKPVTVVTGAVLLLALFDGPLLSRLSALALRGPTRFALAMAGVGIVFAPWSLYPILSISVALKDVLPAIALMGLIAAATRTPDDAYRFIVVQLFGAVLYAAVILTRFNVGPDGRLGNLVYYDANDLGMFLVCTMPLADWLRRRASHAAVRAGAAAAIALFLLTIIKTGSRGAFLGLVAVVIAGLALYRTVSMPRRAATAGAFAALLLVAAGTTYWKAMDTILHPTSDYNWIGNAQGGRMDVWRRGIGYMMAHPVTGVGLGAFPVAEGTISPLASQQAWGVGVKWSVAHNSFVQVGAELGLMGLCAFVGLLTSAFAASMRTAARARAAGDARAEGLAEALAVSLIGYAVAGFFLSQGYAAFLFALVGLILGLARTVPQTVQAGAGATSPSLRDLRDMHDLEAPPHWAVLRDAK